MKMKLLLSLLLVIIIIFSINQTNYSYSEGLCGNYSLTYSKVKDIFEESDISGIIDAYNINYSRDLLTSCSE